MVDQYENMIFADISVFYDVMRIDSRNKLLNILLCDHKLSKNSFKI